MGMMTSRTCGWRVSLASKPFILGFFLLQLLDTLFERVDDGLGLIGGVSVKLFGLLVLSLQGELFKTGLRTFQTGKGLLDLTGNSHDSIPP
jgi:hypothetical protein